MKSESDFVDTLANGGMGPTAIVYAGQPVVPEYVAAPNNSAQETGVAPLDTLPAQWWNWALNLSTQKFNCLRNYVDDILKEMNNLAALLNVTVDPSDSEQLKEIFNTTYPDFLKTSALKTVFAKGSETTIDTGRLNASTVGTKSSAIGNGTTASGDNSLAGGDTSVADGDNSTALGEGTIANGNNQLVFGQYNVADAISVEIVGGGLADNARVNLRTLDGNGNQELKGSDKAPSIIAEEYLYCKGVELAAALANSRFEYKDITDEFDAGIVSTDIANNDFTKYSVGNYIKKDITIPAYKNGSTDVPTQTVTVRIVFAHFNLFYSGVLPDVGTAYTEDAYANVMTPHVACVICDLPNCAMNASNDTTGGYFGSYMHSTFLAGRILTALSGAGITISNHLVGHKKLLTTTVNASGYNRFGTNSGCSNNWEWKDDQYISLMSEVQLYGSTVWSSSGYDTGETNEKLALFNHIRHNKLFGNKNIWLRDIVSATLFALLSYDGLAYYSYAGNAGIAPAPLILLK